VKAVAVENVDNLVVAADHVAPIPAALDPVTAVVLATAVTGMTIRTAAGFVPGETVLIQGATGVAGRLAVKGPGCWGQAGSSLPAVTPVPCVRCGPSARTR
jgi:hypothetical protein